MIIMSLYIFKNNDKLKIPFKNIFITGLIKDDNGIKMSKSNKNIINPIDLINNNNNYIGSDVLRISLLSININNKYINFDKTKIEFGKKFCNKIHNINIFILKNININKNINIIKIKKNDILIFDK
ncbi:class I tRNA ligase family protein [Candidatus Nardonella dryophthoridicola]|uniref:valine--tRNA ligase n=1 Tax=endosymbiont of Metamasius hemipterus TaxID=204627 RepID=A0ABT0TWA5_9GAMM|nr:class I tRNA ligase family protein [Candidatus Nardonella dryophthoridicola]MCM0158282.1 class I tRNA ligase family protein [endosymbiont of Metamasius hemipterus]